MTCNWGRLLELNRRHCRDVAFVFTSSLLVRVWLCTTAAIKSCHEMMLTWHDKGFFLFVFSAEDRKSQILLNKHHHAAHRLSTASWRHRGATDDVMWCWKTIRFYFWGESRQSDFYCSKLELKTWGKLGLNLLLSAPSRTSFSDLLRFAAWTSFREEVKEKHTKCIQKL